MAIGTDFDMRMDPLFSSFRTKSSGFRARVYMFFVSWGLAHYYAHVANKDFDRLTRNLIDELHL